jgi:hypothetical protein
MGIEDMTVVPPIDLDEPFVVAAGCQCGDPTSHNNRASGSANGFVHSSRKDARSSAAHKEAMDHVQDMWKHGFGVEGRI